jgi:predicted dehydrogenase
MSEINRRTFLGAATASGVALASAGFAAQPANDKLLVAVIGTGGRGTGLAQAFARLPGVEVTHVCDADRGRADNAAGVVNKATEGKLTPQVATDLRRVLDDKNLNAVVIATCNHWHAPAAILACAAGKHVYVEKPCSYNPREGELLVQAARKHHKLVQMGNQRRSYPKVIEAMAELRKGVIGRVYFAESWYQANRGTIGRGKEATPPKGLDYALWQGPAPHRPFHTNYLHYNWHWFWHWGNGELGNNGVHIIDLCRWGLGVDYPIRVTSAGGRFRFDDDQETPDTHLVTFEFPGKKQIMWEGLSCSVQPNRTIVIEKERPTAYHSLFHGETGTLALSDRSYVITPYDTKQPPRTEKVEGGDSAHFRNFLDAIRKGGRLNSDIEEAHKTTLLCHLGNISQRTGRALRCDPKNGTILDDKAAMAMWTREYAKGWEPRV